MKRPGSSGSGAANASMLRLSSKFAKVRASGADEDSSAPAAVAPSTTAHVAMNGEVKRRMFASSLDLTRGERRWAIPFGWEIGGYQEGRRPARQPKNLSIDI